MVMVKPQPYIEAQGEWLVARTLSSARRRKVLVQVVNLGDTPVERLPIADVFTVPKKYIELPCPGVKDTCATLATEVAALEDSQY